MKRSNPNMTPGRTTGWALAGLTGLFLVLQAAAPAVAQPDANVDQEVKAAIEVMLSGDMIDSVEAGMKLGTLGKPAVAPLIALLKEPREGVKYLAASALGDIGADAAPAIPNLIELLSDEDAEVRMGAAEALGKIKAQADIVVPALQDLADDPEDPVRSAAGAALLRMGVGGDAAAQASAEMLEGLKSENSTTRSTTLRSLGADPALAKANAAAIIAAVEDENVSVAAEAMRMLATLGGDGKAGVPVLIRQLGSADSFIVSHAVETLGHMGTVAKGAVPALIGVMDKDELLLDPEAQGVIAKAAKVLGFGTGGATRSLAAPAAIAIDQIEPGNKAAQAVMSRMLSDRKGDAEYRVNIAEHLLKSGESGPEVTDALVQAVDDGVEHTRRRAALLLAGLGRAEGVSALVEVLKEALEWDNEAVPIEAVNALAKLGPAARAALPALQEAAGGKSALGEAARKAIAKIEGG